MSSTDWPKLNKAIVLRTGEANKWVVKYCWCELASDLEKESGNIHKTKTIYTHYPGNSLLGFYLIKMKFQ